jgi:hypothetical protein
MTLTNYRDLSTPSSDVSAGFQFEFFCEACGETQRSAFQPYRKGQITGWLSRFTFLFTDLNKASRATGAFADAGAASAKSEALAEAASAVAPHYQHCDDCHKWVGRECWNERAECCTACAQRASAGTAATPGTPAPSQAGTSCPNCQAPSEGGRFCHECGFDMASTHKSCPGCGALQWRAARFCTDCGHGF